MGERNLVNMTITMTRKERIALRQIAAAKEKTVSALVRDWLHQSQKEEKMNAKEDDL